MVKTWRALGGGVVVACVVAFHHERLNGQTHAPEGPSPAVPPIQRVRTVDPTIAALIARAVESSSTFRRVVETIDATDGIVYIEPGRCAIARSCLILRVKIAGPSRLLRIRVDPKRPDCEVMASIAHELWHTVEVLRELALRTDAAVFFFYARESRRPDRTGDPSGTWETPEAVKTGDDVRAELRRRLVDDPRRQAC